MRKKKNIPWHERRVDDYGPGLLGAGTSPLGRQRGLRGAKLGPANEGRRLSDEERAAVERKMREDGKL